MNTGTTMELDGNEFQFDEGCHVERYDEWSFYKKRILPSLGENGAKGCDAVVIRDDTLYLIEAKDYSPELGRPAPSVDKLTADVNTKFFDTLAGLAAGARFHGNTTQDFCLEALRCTRVVACLSIEHEITRSRNAPAMLVTLQDALRRKTTFLSVKPKVVSNKHPDPSLPWTSVRLSGTK